MKISIIGTNGMISEAMTKCFLSYQGNHVYVYGLEKPVEYPYSGFTKLDLLKDKFDDVNILNSDLIIYAAGAGVQAAINTDSSMMYRLNVNVPIELTLQLKKNNYHGIFISFGSYMEIGINNIDGKSFNENEVICSSLPVTNDYALSKRLFSRYMNDFSANFSFWHFILPNMFSLLDTKPGTRLIPYVLEYLSKYNAGENIEKPRFSAGLQTRQYILLEEIIDVVQRSIESKLTSGIYNIGGGEFLSIRSLIERLFKIYNVTCDDILFGKETRRDGDIKSLLLNGDRLFKAIHFLPHKKMEEIFSMK